MRYLMLGTCAGLAVLSIVGFMGAGDSHHPAGQIIFSSVQDLGAGASLAGPGDLEILECVGASAGVLVRGSVPAEDPLVQVAVDGGERGTSGQRVGIAYATDAQLFEGAEPGDFRVLIPWAGQGTRFALDLRGASSDLEPWHSEPVSCPDD